MDLCTVLIFLVYLILTIKCVVKISKLEKANKKIEYLEERTLSTLVSLREYKRVIRDILKVKEIENNWKITYTSELDTINKKIEKLVNKLGYKYQEEKTKKIDACFIKKGTKK